MKKFCLRTNLENNTVAFKRLSEADAALLSDIATRAYSDHYLHLWYDGGAWYLQTYFTVTRFKEELRDTNAWFFCIYYNTNAVGFLKLNIDKPLTGATGNALELERIYLTNEARGQGIGTKAVEFTMEIAAQQQKELVWLKVMDSSGNAIRFYQRLGFEICGTYRLTFAQLKEDLRGMFIMKKDVAQQDF